eukprot:1331882-Amorphochlora_amoeboformis.AAC.2
MVAKTLAVVLAALWGSISALAAHREGVYAARVLASRLSGQKFPQGAYGEVVKSAVDDRIYRAGILKSNNLTFLLVSDPNTRSGAAAIDVRVG